MNQTTHRGGHDHDNPDDLVIGCSACIVRVQADQEDAELAAAPVRRCTWHCRYMASGRLQNLTFALDVPVPAGWSGDQVDEWYAELSGDAFLMALPSSVPIAETDNACWTMGVERVAIGAIVSAADPTPGVDMPSLFDEFTK